jgi:hypothetical protein
LTASGRKVMRRSLAVKEFELLDFNLTQRWAGRHRRVRMRRWRWCWPFRPASTLTIDWVKNVSIRHSIPVAIRTVAFMPVIPLARRTLERIESAERPSGGDTYQKCEQPDSKTENETSNSSIHGVLPFQQRCLFGAYGLTAT